MCHMTQCIYAEQNSIMICACATQLAQEVEQDEDVGEEASTTPVGVDVLALLRPLEPHAHAVLQEGADQAEARQVRQVVFGNAQELPDEDHTHFNQQPISCKGQHLPVMSCSEHFLH